MSQGFVGADLSFGTLSRTVLIELDWVVQVLVISSSEAAGCAYKLQAKTFSTGKVCWLM